MRILLSAAEASSDIHGARVLKALRKKLGVDLYAFGIGGPALQAEGLETIVDSRRLLSMGFTEVLGRLPQISQALKQVTAVAARENPDVALLIDYPDFHFRLAAKLKRLGIPVICFIPPKTWVWRSSRSHLLQERYDRVLSILPFEEAYYQARGVKVEFVGNPVVEELENAPSRAQARASLGLSTSARVVALLPGSRPSELKRHFEMFLDAADMASRSVPLEVIITLPATENEAEAKARLKAWLEHRPRELAHVRVLSGQSALALRAADAALIKSGTATLEAGILGCPHAVVYKPSLLTELIFKNFIRYKGPVGLVNIVYCARMEGFSVQFDKPYPFREILMSEVTVPTLAAQLSILIDREALQSAERVAHELLTKLRCELPTRDRVASDRVAEVLVSIARLPQRSMSGSGLPSGLNASLSFLWSSVNWVMRWLVGFKKPIETTAKVVSVGNAQVGGTGKTPVVAMIAREAIAKGLKTAILIRGYRGTWEKCGGILRPGEIGDPMLCGDEAALLAMLVPQAWVGVGASRRDSLKRLETELGSNFDVVVLDDGMQVHSIKKDLEIITMTGLGRRETVFREFDSSIPKNALLVFTKGIPNRELASMRRVTIQLKPKVLESHLPSIAPPLWLITGVADPTAVEETVRVLGYSLVRHTRHADHFSYNDETISTFVTRAKKLRYALAFTGKDWVKWRRRLEYEEVPWVVFEPIAEVVEGRENWSHALSELWH